MKKDYRVTIEKDDDGHIHYIEIRLDDNLIEKLKRNQCVGWRPILDSGYDIAFKLRYRKDLKDFHRKLKK